MNTLLSLFLKREQDSVIMFALYLAAATLSTTVNVLVVARDLSYHGYDILDGYSAPDLAEEHEKTLKSKVRCFHKGRDYVGGEVFQDKCNTCQCIDVVFIVSCTQVMCLGPTSSNGKSLPYKEKKEKKKQRRKGKKAKKQGFATTRKRKRKNKFNNNRR